MRLVYLSPVPWASFSQRPHKFVEWFHNRTGGNVLWVEPYPTRLPIFNDFRFLPSANHKLDNQAPPPTWLHVIKPRALPVEPIRGLAMLNSRIWKHDLNKIDTFVGKRSGLLVIGKPSMLGLAVQERLKRCRSVYDAMDNFPAFYKGISRDAMSKHEIQLVQRVNIVWASSTELKQKFSKVHAQVRLLSNGLDASVLALAESAAKDGRKTVFGYVGTIADWFDWDILIALAQAQTDNIIRLIGPVFHPVPPDLPNNVELLPGCNHEQALKFMRDFDVGLIPFKVNDLTDSVDPIKYYEYKALGLPIISTDFGEMRFRASDNGVFVCKSIKDARQVTESAINFRQDQASAVQFAMQNTWEVRFNGGGILP